MSVKEILNGKLADGVSADEIEKAVNKYVGENFVDKKRYNDKLTEISDLNGKLNTATDDLAASKTWEEKYNTEKTAHEATKNNYTAEKEAEKADKILSAFAKEKGLNEKVVDKAVKLFDRKNIEFDEDGNIKNGEKVLELLKSDWADFFGETIQQGSNVGNSNVGGNKNYAGKSATELMQIANENPEQINEIMEQIELMNKPKKE
ncbi:MAG: hypothetical protein FWD23_16115 [Oscillospiraceae bacterium]|nr:hypothetical protein [Oscillospiraceae bacterium]